LYRIWDTTVKLKICVGCKKFFYFRKTCLRKYTVTKTFAKPFAKFSKINKSRIFLKFLIKNAKLFINMWNKGTIFEIIVWSHKVLADFRANFLNIYVLRIFFGNICFPESFRKNMCKTGATWKIRKIWNYSKLGFSRIFFLIDFRVNAQIFALSR